MEELIVQLEKNVKLVIFSLLMPTLYNNSNLKNDRIGFAVFDNVLFYEMQEVVKICFSNI